MPKTAVVPPGTTAPIAPYSPGVLADDIVYVSGTLPFDKQNNVVHVGNAAAQTRHVLETIKSVIETAGGTMADVTFNSIFITDWANYAAINQVYAEYFPGDKPARFCIQCGLVKPDALVEIATMAKAKDTGARGLRSIIEDIMLDIMYELPDRAAKEKGKYVVTAEVVRKQKSLFDTIPVSASPAKSASERKKESA